MPQKKNTLADLRAQKDKLQRETEAKIKAIEDKERELLAADVNEAVKAIDSILKSKRLGWGEAIGYGRPLVRNPNKISETWTGQGTVPEWLRLIGKDNFEQAMIPRSTEAECKKDRDLIETKLKNREAKPPRKKRQQKAPNA